MSLFSARWIVGIDEAGRGPLAGPVVAAGVKMILGMRERGFGLLKGIRDSKKLTPKQREEWFQILTNHPQVQWAVARVWPRVIDRINIAQAVNLGVLRVFRALRDSFGDDISEQRIWVLLDGSLRLPENVPHEVIIKGDEKEPLIAAASIIAKVTRDRIMARLHKKYPQYGFDRHKGYGTRAHREAIVRIGISPVHRASFRVV